MRNNLLPVPAIAKDYWRGFGRGKHFLSEGRIAWDYLRKARLVHYSPQVAAYWSGYLDGVQSLCSFIS